MTDSVALPPTRRKWWHWQLATPAETLLYLLVMALISGLISLLLNHTFTGSAAWGHFVSGAILSVVINSVTLWLKRHRRHA